MLISTCGVRFQGRRFFRLKVQDLDFLNNHVRLWTRKREDGNWEFDWVPMVGALRDFLKYWLELREKDSEYVLVCVEKTAFTQEPYGQTFTSRQHLMERLCAKAKARKFGFHAIKHLTATELFREGCTVAEIQKILRHKSPTTTVRYLNPIGVDDTRMAMDNLEAKFKDALRQVQAVA